MQQNSGSWLGMLGNLPPLQASPLQAPPVNPMLTEQQLTPAQELGFWQWFNKQAASGAINPNDARFYRDNGYGYDYDFRKAFQMGLTPSGNGHWGDAAKKPNHPTFSNESRYAQGQYAPYAGQWAGEQYIPPLQVGRGL